MYHPRNRVCYYSWRPVDKKNISVNSLVFHSSEPSWMFCATNDGVVTMWDVGIPNLPYYNGCEHKILIKMNPDYGDIYNIVWSGHESNWLLAGCAAGLVGWNVKVDEIKEQRSNYQPMMVEFLLPVSDKDEGENPVVDSVCMVREWSVVTKCAGHGLIYLWDLETTAANLGHNVNEEIVEKEVELLSKYKWSDTDKFFMNMGCYKDDGLVVCGDEQGTLWLYHMSTMVQTDPKSVNGVLEPNTRILWPEIQDDYNRNPGSNEIFVNKVATNWNSEFIVAVTSSNIVCIWRRMEEAGDM